MPDAKLYLGDCLDVLPAIASESVDAVITDPPYPHIKRDYGYWTTEEWWALIVEGVVPEVRRILKPTGSAVFILQPNSEKVGKMRGWLWEFMAWVCREWNLIRDMYWWNYTSLATGEGIRRGLPKLTVKPCVWAGSTNAYRDRAQVMWSPSQETLARRKESQALEYHPSGVQIRRAGLQESIRRNGGCIPQNLIPMSYGYRQRSAGAHGHGAGTPLKLADWWTRYICPPGGTVLDPFMGSGTMGVAALQNGCSFIGIEKMPGQGYFATAQQRIGEALGQAQQMRMAV